MDNISIESFKDLYDLISQGISSTTCYGKRMFRLTNSEEIISFNEVVKSFKDLLKKNNPRSFRSKYYATKTFRYLRKIDFATNNCLTKVYDSFSSCFCPSSDYLKFLRYGRTDRSIRTFGPFDKKEAFKFQFKHSLSFDRIASGNLKMDWEDDIRIIEGKTFFVLPLSEIKKIMKSSSVLKNDQGI